MAKKLPEFPTEWHQERYLGDLQRELQGTRDRGDKDYEQAVLDEIARVSGKKTASKRPAKARETR